jgi:Dioxygenase
METSTLFRVALPGLALVAALVPVTRAQVDPDWLRMWREAQTHRPSTLGPSGRIAPAGEPGTPLVVAGQVFDPSGTRPAANVVVFAYQTDRDGIYFGPGKPGRPWRLQGWTKTGEDGRFEFRTVRPGPYPHRHQPAHIHIALESPVYGRQWTDSLLFADDPLVSADERARSAAAGRFGHVCDLRIEDGVAHVRISIRLKDAPDF